MSKKNKKSKSKKNNKKRLAIILSSILGTGILATAITLPIVLTRKSNKDGDNIPGPLDYLDHFSKEVDSCNDLVNFDPNLHIFKGLTIQGLSETPKDITNDIISNITSNYDEVTAQEKTEQFLKYYIFINNAFWGNYDMYIALETDMKWSGSIEYTLKDFKYEFNSNTFNFSFSTEIKFLQEIEFDWGQLVHKKPDGKTTKIYVDAVITNKSKDEITLKNGVSLNACCTDSAKGIYSFKCIDSQEKTNETALNSAFNTTTYTNEETGEIYEPGGQTYSFLYLQSMIENFYSDWKCFGPFSDITLTA